MTVNVRVNVAPTAINVTDTAASTDKTMPDDTVTVMENEAVADGGLLVAELDVLDLNDSGDMFGRYTFTTSDNARFEVVQAPNAD